MQEPPICQGDLLADRSFCQDLHIITNVYFPLLTCLWSHVLYKLTTITRKLEPLHLPYHLASSSSTGETLLVLAGDAAFFLEKRARVLTVVAPEAEGADRAAGVKLRGLPNISETPRDAGALAAAMEAISFFRYECGEQRQDLGVWWGVQVEWVYQLVVGWDMDRNPDWWVCLICYLFGWSDWLVRWRWFGGGWFLTYPF